MPTMFEQAVGNAIAEWTEEEPLRWVMRETLGEGRHALEHEISLDLTSLLAGYSRPFLLALKEVLVARRLRVSLSTIQTQKDRLSSLLQCCQQHFAESCKTQGLARVVFDRIDSDFLLGLSAIKRDVDIPQRRAIKSLYLANRDNASLFAPDLVPGDFPAYDDPEGPEGRLRRNVLASAMSRSALVEILNFTEAAFNSGELSLAHFAFSRLLLSRAARPETYRLLRCKDLRIDTSGGSKSYFLTLSIPKARTGTPPQANISIHREVGQLLEKQREAVVSTIGHLVEAKNASLSDDERKLLLYTAGDLPLFPARGTRMFSTTKSRLGMLASGAAFTLEYVRPLQDLTASRITCTGMRHTIGTQLAIAGCSSSTIAAVLLHASTKAARVYVDLIFEGAIDELSDSLEGAFAQHFPVFNEFASAQDEMDPNQRIQSESSDRSRRETTGACGRKHICQYAPIACYECPCFKPCYDVDHAINLGVVVDEIRSAEQGGLQRQVDVKRYTHIANRIRVVINVCEVKRAAVEAERAQAGAVSWSE